MSSILRRLLTVRRRRVVLAIGGIWLLYLFFRNLPTDILPLSERHSSRFDENRVGLRSQNVSQTSDQSIDTLYGQKYNGPIKFYKLGPALRAEYLRIGAEDNILFAFSHLKSSSHIVPLACEMSQYNRTRVHVAFMGRKEMNFKDIISVNGIPESDCLVSWFDARPDYAGQSTEGRMEQSVGASLGHIQRYLSLQAVIIDGSTYEDAFFTKAMEYTANTLSLQLITLPKSGVESISWISSLDGLSLKQWGKVQIDIIVHAAADSSGSLIRLLKSLKDADYSGLPFPRLTIELPAAVDSFTTKYLSQFQWPPKANGAESKLIIRHRIDAKHISPAHASLRTIESFYPVTPGRSHVLLLSPEVEVSRNFYQFAMYALLEFRYGLQMSSLSANLVGLSLDLPARDLMWSDKSSPLSISEAETISLLQLPTSRAGLYFGDKWLELHTFLAKWLTNDPELSQRVGNSETISDKYPSWLKVMFEMMRTQGYLMLYPVTTHREGNPLVTVHQELHQMPEEYTNLESVESSSTRNRSTIGLDDDTLLTGEASALGEGEQELPVLGSASVAKLLGRLGSPREKIVPKANTVPIYSNDGKQMTWEEVQKQTSLHADQFALSVGRCFSAHDRGQDKVGSFDNLFCTPKR